jgi:hypothetical protein
MLITQGKSPNNKITIIHVNIPKQEDQVTTIIL